MSITARPFSPATMPKAKPAMPSFTPPTRGLPISSKFAFLTNEENTPTSLEHNKLHMLFSKLGVYYQHLHYIPHSKIAPYILVIEEILSNTEAWGGNDALPVLGKKIINETSQDILNLSVEQINELNPRQQLSYYTEIYTGFDEFVPVENDSFCPLGSTAFIALHARSFHAANFLGIAEASSVERASVHELEIFTESAVNTREMIRANIIDQGKILRFYRKNTARKVNELRYLIRILDQLKIQDLNTREISSAQAEKYISLATGVPIKKDISLSEIDEIAPERNGTKYVVDFEQDILTENSLNSFTPEPSPTWKRRKFKGYSVDKPPKKSDADELKKRHNESMICPSPFKRSYVMEELALDFIKEHHPDDEYIHPYVCPCGAIHIGHSWVRRKE